MAYRVLRPIRRLQHYTKSPVLRKSANKLCSNLSANSNSVEQEGILKKKMNQLVQWYEETTGMDEVRMAQSRVLDAEERFIRAQDRRRESNKEVVTIQNKLKDLYAELDNTTRGEERYVTLITEEHKLLKQEKHVMSEFKRYEREEREHFSALSSAVKESHEKERAQAERTKYWSIIGSIIGTIIGIVGSSVNNELRMKELRKLIKESTTLPVSSAVPFGSSEDLSRHERELNAIANVVSVSLKQTSDVVKRLDDVITLLDNKVKTSRKTDSDNVLEVFTQQQLELQKNLREMKAILATQTENSMNNNEHSYKDTQQDGHATAKMVFLSAVVVIFPVLFRYFDLFS